MATYTRTLYLPGLHAQYKIWKTFIGPLAGDVDKIIQLGNVIGCTDFVKDDSWQGPNEGILTYVITRRAHKDNWTQLIGPNEMAALNFPNEWTNDKSNRILREAWFGDEKIFKVAAVDKNRLVSHGGLTFGEWLSIGKPQTAQEAADLLNAKYENTVYQGPGIKLGDPPNFYANPIWADYNMELLPSWITAPEVCPFDQITGSGSTNTVAGRELSNSSSSILHYIDKTRFNGTGSISTIKGANFTAVDYNIELTGDLMTTVPARLQFYIEKTKTEEEQ